MIVKYALKRIKKVLYYIIFLIKANLISKKNYTIKCLINLLKETLHNTLANEEEQQINSIETIREILDSSKKEIQIVDYGAGKSGNELPKNIMDKGRIIKTKVEVECKIKSSKYKKALLLFKIVRWFKPHKCLELGTGLGISSAYIGKALELNSYGKLYTLEGSGAFVEIAKSVHNRLQLVNVEVIEGRFQDCLIPLLEKENPFDFFFIDGHHDKYATIDYFNKILPFLSEKAIIIIDDISWSDGMKKAWSFIIMSNKTQLNLKLGNIGVCLKDSSFDRKMSYTIPFSKLTN